MKTRRERDGGNDTKGVERRRSKVEIIGPVLAFQNYLMDCLQTWHNVESWHVELNCKVGMFS
jgi:hypothetical protein